LRQATWMALRASFASGNLDSGTNGMQRKDAAETHPPRRDRPAGQFSPESATETLVFVGPVMRDIVETYQELMRLRAERGELALVLGVEAQLADLRGRIDQKVERLRALHQELVGVGCEPKDLSAGLVDFPALYEGRKVWLCWKLGEPEVAWWHECRDGFAGRRPIDAQFRRRLRESLPAGIKETGSRQEPSRTDGTG